MEQLEFKTETSKDMIGEKLSFIKLFIKRLRGTSTKKKQAKSTYPLKEFYKHGKRL